MQLATSYSAVFDKERKFVILFSRAILF